MSYILHPFRFLILIFVAFLSACPKDIPPPKNLIQEPTVLRNAINGRSSSLESVRFKEIVLEYFGKNKRVKIRQLILAKKPTRLRVQTRLPGSEEILSLLVSDGNTFSMHRRDTNQYFFGKATPENIGLLLPVNLSASDFVRILFGGAPWDRFDSFSATPATKVNWDSKKGCYIYRVTHNARSLEMEVRPTDFAVLEVREKNEEGKIVYQYKTDDWKKVGGQVALPSWIHFIWPDRDLDFSLRVRETQTNVELPNVLFELEAPGGSQMIDIDNIKK